MSETRRPDPCHHDRTRGQRVTKRHRNDCTDRACGGCVPCTAPHCPICGRGHLDNNHPHTCTGCVASIRQDLDAVMDAHHDLHVEAWAGTSSTGQLLAAAPIPGGDAAVLSGPTVQLAHLLTYRGFDPDDHRVTDPTPPLAVLADWEDRWRAWLDLGPAGRASLPRTCRVLRDDIVPVVAQDDPADGGPDLTEMAKTIRQLRDQLEHALHDEREPERGVDCFECDGRLVRRFRAPRPCRHMTPAREWWLTLASYPELQPTVREAQAARAACDGCDQGGISDPSAGESWECPGCRKVYDPGEYATAVRRSLMDSDDAMGWCTLPTAAEAAADITHRPISAATIRTWIARGDDIAVCCLWSEGRRFGVQLVYWPDVASRVTESRRRGRPAARRSA